MESRKKTYDFVGNDITPVFFFFFRFKYFNALRNMYGTAHARFYCLFEIYGFEMWVWWAVFQWDFGISLIRHCFLQQLTLQSRHLISSFTSWEINLWSWHHWHHWHHKVFCAYHEWMGFNIVWSQFISKISSCVSHRRNSHRFETTWGWVAKWGQPLFGWSVPLKTHTSHSDRCLFNVVLKKPTSP